MPFIREFIGEVFEKQQFKGLLNMNFAKEGPVGWDNCEILDQACRCITILSILVKTVKAVNIIGLAVNYSFEPEETPTDVASIKEGKVTVVALTWKQQDDEGTAQMREILGTIKK